MCRVECSDSGQATYIVLTPTYPSRLCAQLALHGLAPGCSHEHPLSRSALPLPQELVEASAEQASAEQASVEQALGEWVEQALPAPLRRDQQPRHQQALGAQGPQNHPRQRELC